MIGGAIRKLESWSSMNVMTLTHSTMLRNFTKRKLIRLSTIIKFYRALTLSNLVNNFEKNKTPLFINNQHNKLTKEGIAYIVAKYVKMARRSSPLVPPKVKVHMFRHSKAMHLLQAGVNLIYLRDYLGHVDLKTTEIYARTDTETKRKAIENAYPELIDNNLPDWSEDQTLLSWLSELK